MKPLAQELRPQTFEEVAGQEEIVQWMQRTIRTGRPLSILLWGPPGSGKTTLARLYASAFPGEFVTLSAVEGSLTDFKKRVQEIKAHPLLHDSLLVFVDEIHRFNKAQQDFFLPYVEDGTILLIGATTENPSFSLNSALLSRLRVLTLNALNSADLEILLERAEKKLGPLPLTPEARSALVHLAQGDGRHLMNMIENVQGLSQTVGIDQLHALVQRRAPLYDSNEEGHYNLISALHKAVRGSDPDAALYWLARMLAGGEDPQFLARRIVRMATEDIGLADPQALDVALNAWRAFDQLGTPEGELALAEAIVYLALAPKSNAIYVAWGQARSLAEKTSHLPPPKIILNAPTRFMKALGYGKGYQYDHDQPDAFSGQNYFPDGVERKTFYEPVERGFERELKKRVDYFEKKRKKSFLPPKNP